MHYLLPLIIIAAAISVGNAFAKTDGTAGKTSTGNINVNATVPPLVKISPAKLINIHFSSLDLSDPSFAYNELCVYSNIKGGKYRILARSQHGIGKQFRLTDGEDYLTYAVTWYSAPYTTGPPTPLQHNTYSTTLVGANTQSLNCSIGGPSASIHIKVSTDELEKADSGIFYDTMTLEASA